MIWTEGRQPDCYGCHCSYLITDSGNQNSQSLMGISYDDMNRGWYSKQYYVYECNDMNR